MLVGNQPYFFYNCLLFLFRKIGLAFSNDNNCCTLITGFHVAQVKDASPLKALKKLKTLYVAGTPADEDAVTLAGVRGNGTKVIN